MPQDGSEWSRSSPCDLARVSDAWLSPTVPGWGHCQAVLSPTWHARYTSPCPPHLEGQLRAHTASPAALPWGFATAGSWHLHPLWHQKGQAVVKLVIRHAQCRATGLVWSPGDGMHTDSKAPWVEGVPGEVGHRHTVLDGGHGGVGETARLGELGERARGSPAPYHRCCAVPAAVPRWGYLEDGDLSAGREQGESNALVVGTEAVTLARRGEAESPQVGEVGVAVQHPALRVSEAGAGPWRGWGMGECPGCPPLARSHHGGAETVLPPAHPKCSAATSGWGC